jgi:signal transduction histidine kinase
MQSDKRASESHLRKIESLQNEVQALRRQLAESQKLATVGTMTAMVAHEFNNILTPIVNYAQLAQRNPQMLDKAIHRAMDGGQRAACICNAILRMSREKPGTVESIRLRELIDETLQAMARDLSKDGIELVLDVEESLEFYGDRVGVQQTLLNLILNARQAILAKGGRGRIEISAAQENGWMRLSVRDNGTGIDEADSEQIFQPFYSTRAADSECGTGLGLAICRRFVHEAGGEIRFESTPGVGTNFLVDLPAPRPAA